MLQAIDLAFRHVSGGPWLFEGVRLDLGPGRVLGLRGQSGEGKTTLARLLAGYLRPASGSIVVDGHPLGARGRCPVQMVFQHPELSFNPYVRMTKALAEAGPEASAMVDPLAIESRLLSRFPHQLSGGELQRIALARALGSATRYLIADEATAMLDAIAQASIWKFLLGLVQERGIGLLAISHDAELLRRVADDVVDMKALRRRSS